MKLFHSPGSCSQGIQMLLDVIGAPYELVVTELAKGAHRDPAYLSLNPKGKVPALMLPDGSVLTEFPVIAYWLARSFPEANLLPEGLDAEIRVMELTEHIVSGLHMRGSVFAMAPQKFLGDEAAKAELRKHGQEVIADGFQRLSDQLGDKEFLFGTFTITDAAAGYLLSWADRIGVERPPELDAYYERLTQLTGN
ncbi:glutathione S-transferase family protein [Celeribacter litoreus]|uniref:glutathione S-transferase family protein n=1 Tax=Celeribacter litoreus TaxID=2876714 RepID=UPI001CCC23FD|nr:glutathione S-transferase family protein [Celeribacter litoreus]MCA0042014.1 glutathione S-transferase family protein [Celeribacter litoreus]